MVAGRIARPERSSIVNFDWASSQRGGRWTGGLFLGLTRRIGRKGVSDEADAVLHGSFIDKNGAASIWRQARVVRSAVIVGRTAQDAERALKAGPPKHIFGTRLLCVESDARRFFRTGARLAIEHRAVPPWLGGIAQPVTLLGAVG